MAVERGEADARIAGIPLILREGMHWLQEGFTLPVIVRNSTGMGTELYPEFPRQQLPGLEQFVDTDLKRAIFNLYRASRAGASNFIVHKDIPRPALDALKEAFGKVWKDSQFAEEYTRMTREVPTPVTGDEIHELLRQIPADQKVLDVYKQIIGAGPLPPAK